MVYHKRTKSPIHAEPKQTNIPLLEQSRLQPPNITKYFYHKALLENRQPDQLPITLDEALKL